MNETSEPQVGDRRLAGRAELGRTVTVRFSPPEMIGPGHNISEQGVFFETDEKLRVSVTIEGDDRVFEGDVVRVQSMDEGKTGVAIRFDPLETEPES